MMKKRRKTRTNLSGIEFDWSIGSQETWYGLFYSLENEKNTD